VDLQTVDILSRFAGAAAAVIASCTVAGLTAYFAARQARIAQRQANIAQDKLALDLFQRRIDVYSTVRRAIAEITRSGASSNSTEITLLEGIDAARFLFGADVRGYLDDLYKHLIDLDYCNKAFNDPNLTQQERANNSQARSQHFLSITAFYKDMDGLFGPYLSAHHIRFAK
jgi:hypothetical protein